MPLKCFNNQIPNAYGTIIARNGFASMKATSCENESKKFKVHVISVQWI